MKLTWLLTQKNTYSFLPSSALWADSSTNKTPYLPNTTSKIRECPRQRLPSSKPPSRRAGNYLPSLAMRTCWRFVFSIHWVVMSIFVRWRKASDEAKKKEKKNKKKRKESRKKKKVKERGMQVICSRHFWLTCDLKTYADVRAVQARNPGSSLRRRFQARNLWL